MPRPEGTKSARVIQVIETRAMRGMGIDRDPSREVTQYWSLDGEFLACSDPVHDLACIHCDAENVKHDAEILKKRLSAVDE